MSDVVICFRRAYAGGLLQWSVRLDPAHELGAVVIKGALERAKVSRKTSMK